MFRAQDLRVNAEGLWYQKLPEKNIDSSANVALFVRTDRPLHSRRNENFIFNQSYPSRSIKSLIACTKEIAETLRERPISVSKWVVRPPVLTFGKYP